MKRNILFLIVCLFGWNVCAQDFFSAYDQYIKSTNQQLIEDAVMSGIYLVETSYQLEDSTGQRFGIDGKPYFNRFERVGFAMNGAIVLPSHVFQPWVKDVSVNQYRNDYKPVLLDLKMRNWQDSVFHPIDSMNIHDTISLWDGYVAARQKGVAGFTVDTEAGSKEGWLILVMNKNKKPTLQCIRKPIQIDSIGEQTVEVPSSLQNVMGGVYVLPVIEGVGRITFKLCGVVAPAANGNRLTVMHPFVGKDYTERIGGVSKGGKLQPVKMADKVVMVHKKTKKK
jgi:hypothetical protein